jgi:hypothetical protein
MVFLLVIFQKTAEFVKGPAAFSKFHSITKDIINENNGFFNEKQIQTHDKCHSPFITAVTSLRYLFPV